MSLSIFSGSSFSTYQDKLDDTVKLKLIKNTAISYPTTKIMKIILDQHGWRLQKEREKGTMLHGTNHVSDLMFQPPQHKWSKNLVKTIDNQQILFF